MKTRLSLFLVIISMFFIASSIYAKESNCDSPNGTFVLVFGSDFYLTSDQDGLNDSEADGYPIYRVFATGFEECKILEQNQDRILKKLPSFDGFNLVDIKWADRNLQELNEGINEPQGRTDKINADFVSLFPEFRKMVIRIEFAAFYIYPNNKHRIPFL